MKMPNDFCEECGALYTVCVSVERFRGLCYACFEKRAKDEERRDEAIVDIDGRLDKAGDWLNKWNNQDREED